MYNIGVIAHIECVWKYFLALSGEFLE